MKNLPVPTWLLMSLAEHSPTEVYEETVLNCSDEQINLLSRWISHLMREFDEALVDV